MKLFEQYFTKHHFFHHPHQWFLAFLVSPIHFLEMHYKKRYHLQFAHAKKLFAFDMSLLAGIIFLTGLTAFYILYHGSIASLVYLNITLPEGRVISGNYVEYTIHYRNESNIKLTKATLAVQMPVGFVLDKAEPQEIFKNNLFHLNTIPPAKQGQVTIAGWLFDTPNKENSILAKLNYQQEKKQYKELKISRLISVLRGSVLQGKISAEAQTILGNATPLTLTLQNTGKQTLKDITVPLNAPQDNAHIVEIISAKPNLGKVENNFWEVAELQPGASAQLNLKLKLEFNNFPNQFKLNFTPNLKINNETIPQEILTHFWQLLRPGYEIYASWKNENGTVQPGQTGILQLQIKNSGNTDLKNTIIALTLPPFIVDLVKARQLNGATLQNNQLLLDKKQFPALAEMKVGESTDLEIPIPVVMMPQGNIDLNFSLPIHLSAKAANLEQENNFEMHTDSPALKVGTQINLQGEARYYTAEGDQLGRGPLPPEVGKETKYWTMVTAINNTSEADNVKFKAELPAGIVWTGKTSATRGQAIVYSDKTRQISWSTNYLAPYEKIGLYFELSLTPTAAQIGTTPIILKNISLTADDSFINLPIKKTLPDLDVSLINDEIGRTQGVMVK